MIDFKTLLLQPLFCRLLKVFLRLGIKIMTSLHNDDSEQILCMCDHLHDAVPSSYGHRSVGFPAVEVVCIVAFPAWESQGPPASFPCSFTIFTRSLRGSSLQVENLLLWVASILTKSMVLPKEAVACGPFAPRKFSTGLLSDTVEVVKGRQSCLCV